MKLTRQELLERDAQDSGRLHSATISPEHAEEIANRTFATYRRLGYRMARDQAIEDILPIPPSEKEFAAYKEFVNRRFGRRAKDARDIKNRPFAPVETYEDDMR